MMLPLAGRRSQLAKSSNLVGFLVGPAPQLVPLTDQAFVTHVDKFTGSVCRRPTVKKANARMSKYRDHFFQLFGPTTGKFCKSHGGRWRSPVSVLISFREAGKHDARDVLLSFVQ